MALINGTEGSELLIGTGEDDQIFALGGNDTVSGQDGDDVLDGGTGDDVLAGNAGADTLTGGSGSDRFSWRITASFLPVDSTSLAQDTVLDFEGAGAAGGDTLDLVESTSRRMVFEGALVAMPATGASLGFGGNGFTEVFYAFDGGDTVVFADSDDDGIFDADDFSVRLSGEHQLVLGDFGATPFVLRGTEGDDVIVGTDANDTIFGLGGDDRISGGLGADNIDGGEGQDTLDGGAGNDVLNGGGGNDVLLGGDGIDRITGGDGNDLIDGGAGRDTVLAGGNGNDRVMGGAGDDTLDGDDGNDQLFGGADDDDLFGGDGNDRLFGEDGDDFLEGLDGNDEMFGGAGDDELIGDAGADIQSGGAGEDTFRFFLGSFNPSSPFSNPDTVVDFEGAGIEGGDEIRIGEQLVFRGELGINPKAGAILPGGGNGLTDIGYAIKGNTTWLIADDDDDGQLGGSDFAVRFQGTHRFTEDDFRSATFVIAGTNGDDTLVGTEDGDFIFGLGGDDSIFGLGGDDEIDGGAGDDFVDGGTGFANLSGGEGNDTLTLQASEFGGNASGGAGDDVLIGAEAPFSFSFLEGGEGNDTLRATGGDTSLADFGGGDDRLEGGPGDDQFTGGDGLDLFVFGAVWTTPGSGFTDIIWDLEDGAEKIDLRASGLTFADLTIDDLGFSAIVTSSAGRIEVVGFGENGTGARLTEDDFLFA